VDVGTSDVWEGAVDAGASEGVDDEHATSMIVVARRRLGAMIMAHQ
jgi:hypothetical protein